MAVSAVGPAWLILARVGLGAIFLWCVALWFKKGPQLSKWLGLALGDSVSDGLLVADFV